MSYVWDKIQRLHKQRRRAQRSFQLSDSKAFKKQQKVLDDWREEKRVEALERLISATNYRPAPFIQSFLDEFKPYPHSLKLSCGCLRLIFEETTRIDFCRVHSINNNPFENLISV